MASELAARNGGWVGLGIMVALVILFPAMVMHYKGLGTGMDPSKVRIEIQQPDLPPLPEFGPMK